MWVKIIIGAIAGLIIGHWISPGYAVWALIGIIIGALLDLVMKTQFNKETEE